MIPFKVDSFFSLLDGKGENAGKMDSSIIGEELIKEAELSAEEENKLNEAGEEVGNETNKIRKKRGRPSKNSEDKEDLPKSKKAKKSPRKKLNLRIRPINNIRKKNRL